MAPERSQRQAPTPVWHRFVAGGAADMCSTLFTHPIDVIKVRLQLRGELGAFGPTSVSRAVVASLVRDEARQRGLYRGLSAALLRHSIFSSLRQGGYGILVYQAVGPGQEAGIATKVAAGSISGLIGAAVANPADLVLVRMQADGHWPREARRNYRHVFDGLRQAVTSEGRGIRVLWRGTSATCTRAAVLTAAQLPSYEYAKQQFRRLGVFSGPDDMLLHVTSSAVAAATCSVVSCPVDVLKTRMMNMKASTQAYTSVWDCAVRTARAEGIFGFWKGLSATFMRLAPHNLVLWVSFEQVSKFLREHAQ